MTTREDIQIDTGLPVNSFYKRSGPSQLTDDNDGPYVGRLIRELAADPNVVEFGWRQYTPYFNDGDICEFGVGELWVRTTEDDEDADTYQLEAGSYHPTFDDTRYERVDRGVLDRWGYQAYDYVKHSKEPQFPETLVKAEALAHAIQRNEVTLLNWFGDHAEIRVTAAGIQVDEYEHD